MREGALRASFADFLRRQPDELASGPVRPTPPGWFDAVRVTELAAVHRRMLAAGYASDEWRHGRPDYWVVDATGDCEDKILWCHHELAALGRPKSAMRLWLCLARQAGGWRGHAVLIIALTLGEGTVVNVALDCLRATPARKADLGYRLWRPVDPATTATAKSSRSGDKDRQPRAPPALERPTYSTLVSSVSRRCNQPASSQRRGHFCWRKP